MRASHPPLPHVITRALESFSRASDAGPGPGLRCIWCYARARCAIRAPHHVPCVFVSCHLCAFSRSFRPSALCLRATSCAPRSPCGSMAHPQFPCNIACKLKLVPIGTSTAPTMYGMLLLARTRHHCGIMACACIQLTHGIGVRVAVVKIKLSVG